MGRWRGEGGMEGAEVAGEGGKAPELRWRGGGPGRLVRSTNKLREKSEGLRGASWPLTSLQMKLLLSAPTTFISSIHPPLPRGSNRSGDLRNAQQSIPLGTLGAVLVTSSIYLLTVLFYGGVAERENDAGQAFGLKTNYLLSADVSLQETITRVGIVLSSLGAALQSLTGAPRLLQAISNDNLMPVLRRLQAHSLPPPPLLFTSHLLPARRHN